MVLHQDVHSTSPTPGVYTMMGQSPAVKPIGRLWFGSRLALFPNKLIKRLSPPPPRTSRSLHIQNLGSNHHVESNICASHQAWTWAFERGNVQHAKHPPIWNHLDLLIHRASLSSGCGIQSLPLTAQMYNVPARASLWEVTRRRKLAR